MNDPLTKLKQPISKPCNPYKAFVWYAIFLAVCAIGCTHSSATDINKFYNLLQSYGLLDLLLMLDRPYRIMHYLLGVNNTERWERISLYFCIFGITLPIVSAAGLIQATRFLRWYKLQNLTWSKPLADKHRKMLIKTSLIGTILVLGMTWTLVHAMSDMTRHYSFANTIQLNDFGFYQHILDAACIYFFLQVIHFSSYRLVHDQRLKTID